MNTIKVTTTQNIEIEYDLASLSERILGYIIDLLIISAYLIVMLIIFLGGDLIKSDSAILFLLIVPVFFYHLASEIFMNGQSVGKKVANIKVISLDGQQPSLGQYMIRWVFRLLDFTITNCICGLVCVAVSEKKQRVGDIVAGTTLIKTVPRTSFQETIYTPVRNPEYTMSFPEVARLGDKDMQLIKEVILSVNRSGNLTLARQAADKIKETLGVQTTMEPLHFLQTLLADYNYTSAMKTEE